MSLHHTFARGTRGLVGRARIGVWSTGTTSLRGVGEDRAVVGDLFEGGLSRGRRRQAEEGRKRGDRWTESTCKPRKHFFFEDPSAFIVQRGPMLKRVLCLATLTAAFSFAPSGVSEAAPVVSGSAARGVGHRRGGIPEYAQAQYTLTAAYAGDDENAAATDDAPCYIAKANTEFDATYNYGALDSKQGSPKYGTVSIYLRRKSDHESIAKPIHISVEGTRSDHVARTTGPIVITLPNKKDIYVKMEFDGDASNHPTMYQDRYQLN
jgi:hypothetical protein